MHPADRLCQLDPTFGAIVARCGPISLERAPVSFHSLVRSILGQQLSGKAADGIDARLRLALAVNESYAPEHFAGHSPDSLRTFGLSRPKASYILDLAQRTAAGELPFAQFEEMSDEELVQRLTQVRGIGEWTVQMQLIFHLARPDVMPSGDLGVQEGVRRLDGLENRPKPAQVLARAEAWRPVRSTAALYLWRLCDAKKTLP
jgi:3-methyladenine DNA glycosylase/8-oxoguanine DNA glycosylase